MLVILLKKLVSNNCKNLYKTKTKWNIFLDFITNKSLTCQQVLKFYYKTML